jgi:hypothetical protein
LNERKNTTTQEQSSTEQRPSVKEQSLTQEQSSTEQLSSLKEHSSADVVSSTQKISSTPKPGLTKGNTTSIIKETAPGETSASNQKTSLSKENSTPNKNTSPEFLSFNQNLKDVSPKEKVSTVSDIEQPLLADQAEPGITDRLKGKTPFLSVARQSAGSPSDIRARFPTPKSEAATLTDIARPRKVKINRWSYGVSASGGISAVNEGKLIAFNNATVEDVSTVAPFAPQQPYTPSSISPGITYSLGAFVQRALTNKWSLSVGLNYLQLNTHNKVGNEINSRAIVNNGNRGFYFVQSYFTIDQDNTREYRNRYHFVEMPVELHLNINNSKKLPMYVNTGISVSRLIRSNSLHFDGTTGVYYRNDKLINRTQVATSAGFAVGLLNRTTRPIQVGPTVRYNVTKILQKDVSARTNFMSFGIDARMFIK